MSHPLIRLALREPRLIIDHLLGYVQSVGDSITGARPSMTRMVMGLSVAIVGLLTALVLSGVSLLLYFAMNAVHPALWIVPLVPLSLAALGLVLAQCRPRNQALAKLKAELERDRELFSAR